jgi:uncharacterized protein (TIGR03067 family)
MAASSVIDEDPQVATLADLQRLQGTWRCRSGRRPAELVIFDHLFALRFEGGETYLGLFRLDPQSRPAAMDMRIDEGPVRHRGKIGRCIYELHGDQLRWCPAEPGSEERPTAFPASEDPRYWCLTFRRDDSEDTSFQSVFC